MLLPPKVYRFSEAQNEIVSCIESLYYEAGNIDDMYPAQAQFRRRVADRLRNELQMEAMAFFMEMN